MSTRSRIAMLANDNKVVSIYCHFDGYPDGVGKYLLNFHNTEEKVSMLISLGDLSCLHEHLEPIEEAEVAYFWGKGTPPTVKKEEHSFENPQKNVTIAYHRDRQEDFGQHIHESLEEYNKNGDFQAYNYLWKDNKWFIKHNAKWIELTQNIVDNDLPKF